MKKQSLQDEETKFIRKRNKVYRIKKQGLQDKEARFTG